MTVQEFRRISNRPAVSVDDADIPDLEADSMSITREVMMIEGGGVIASFSDTRTEQVPRVGFADVRGGVDRAVVLEAIRRACIAGHGDARVCLLRTTADAFMITTVSSAECSRPAVAYVQQVRCALMASGHEGAYRDDH